jgi:hypothetical protein
VSYCNPSGNVDPEARLYKKSAGQEAKLSYLGHTLVENRNGLIAAAMTTQTDGKKRPTEDITIPMR